jgi:hypothetical protein
LNEKFLKIYFEAIKLFPSVSQKISKFNVLWNRWENKDLITCKGKWKKKVDVRRTREMGEGQKSFSFSMCVRHLKYIPPLDVNCLYQMTTKWYMYHCCIQTSLLRFSEMSVLSHKTYQILLLIFFLSFCCCPLISQN